MKTQTAIDYYKTKVALAKAVGLTRGAITHWANDGFVPIGRAYQLQLITEGKLKVDLSVYEDNQPQTAA